MSWKIKTFLDRTEFHESRGFKAFFKQRWFSRFRHRCYRFEYKVATPRWDGEEYAEFTLNEIPVMSWLETTAKGNVRVVVEQTEHTGSSLLRLKVGLKPIYWTTLAIEMSDKSLASLWRLTFGGKPVEPLSLFKQLVHVP
jgi:hypothetical protein